MHHELPTVVGTTTLLEHQQLFNQVWLLTKVVLAIQRNNQTKWAWYNNLEPASIMGFNNLCVKLLSLFNSFILVKNNFAKL